MLSPMLTLLEIQKLRVATQIVVLVLEGVHLKKIQLCRQIQQQLVTELQRIALGYVAPI